MNIRDIKEGDNFTVVACYFQVPDWMDDQPCIILSPVLKYDESNGAYSTIEDFLIDVVTQSVDSDEKEFVDEQLKWVGKSLKSLKRVVSKSLKTGEKPFKSVYSEVVKMVVDIIKDEEGELTWRVLRKQEI
ncbi:MAG: hypothetical protein RSA53_05405 [Odoribacter sp.]